MYQTISAIIVDDEPLLAFGLQSILKKYCPQLLVKVVCHNADDAILEINNHQPQLVFLDISMPGKSAFDMLVEMGDISFEIIFITAHQHYAIQAIKYSAIDYLLKPIDEEELIAAVERAIQKIKNKTQNDSIGTLMYNLKHQYSPNEQKICLPTLNGFQIVKCKDVIYCEADGAYTNFILSNGKKICVSKSLSDYELLLSDIAFLRTHKSYIINIIHIDSYIKGEGGSVTMSNGDNLEVSRRKKEWFLQNLKNYFK